MKTLLLLWAIASVAMAQITMSDAQIKKVGIKVEAVHRIKSEAMGPFIGLFEYSDKGAKNYTLSSEATVVELIKQTGDPVKKGEVICKIASSELLASRYELIDMRNRLTLAQQYARKDALLYKDGIISQRESQKSALEVMTLRTKIGELQNRFIFAGADTAPKDGMIFTIRAQQNGILAHAPIKTGEKIDPFVPYLKIANASAFSAYIKIPPKIIGSIKKGSDVMDKLGVKIGTVSAISSSVDMMNNSATAIATITKTNEQYRAGTSSEFLIASAKTEEWMLLPRVSVTKYKGKDICFVRTATGFIPQTVNIQKIYKEHIAVQPQGFTSREQVVTEGIINLKGILSGMGFE
ncbi:MAG: efflux RND transporter periplasmic adaptor subunit [Campylobacterales bacterium]|nr:efflux RND transporter periplasmic adaptor subunit [Campylobacterales bacterium]